MRPHEFLNKVKWHPDFVFEEYTVVYLHRGAPKNEKSVSCREIVALEHSDFVLEGEEGKIYIPYHRILRILDKNGEIVWKKPH
ncbi:MAG: DUF504 domain-containing protein [Theionarchaea archaeon]|nr:DUF504 domain-containing protein [Theionarchaea archaeon]